MKLLVLAIATMVSAIAVADSFTVVENGTTYLCRPVSSGPGGAVACAQKASTMFSKNESIRLCQGAINVAPADCANKALNGYFSPNQAVEICAGVMTAEPGDCALKARSGGFSVLDSIRLCRQTGTLATADCAIKAFGAYYSREEAIRLCRANSVFSLESLR